MIYQVTISKTIQEDDFEQGCIGFFQDLGEIWTFKSSDLETCIARLKNQIDLKGAEVYDSKLEISRLEMDDAEEPSEACLNAWKAGNVAAFHTKMWAANYTVTLETIETTAICAGQLLDKVQS